MLVAAVTLALLGFALWCLAELVRHDGQKMLAALKGQSWMSQPPASVWPVTIRFTQRYPAARPLRSRAALRVAA
jgi:hypothetical protein